MKNENENDPSKIAAFFDVDGTLLSTFSGTLYSKFLIKEGLAGWGFMVKAMLYYFLHRMGRLNIEKLTKKFVAGYEGRSEAEMIDLCNRWYDATVRPYIRPQMMDAIKEHREKGHEIVLLTASTIYLTRPLGEDLGVDGYICNYLGVNDGLFTGKMVEPLCYGEGKVLHAKKYASKRSIDISSSYFYTDSITDIDVLEIMGHPVVINPDRLLRREAKKRGWPVHDYSHDPGKTAD